ncbi:MAG TPA: 30S ribosomal protein S3ae [Thermoplasmatales archaeon]|nr:30S ribosomal protein S3ae [Thermoplasmatales archaeon]
MAERKKKKTVKNWYALIAPKAFGKTKIAETPADSEDKVIGRTVEVSLQEFTGDFAKAHIKLIFKVVEVSGFEARTAFIGHTTTTDYVKRMARRYKSKIDGVFDVKTKDGVRIRVKPSAYTGKVIKTSQKRAIRAFMKEVIEKLASENTLDEFVKYMLDGEIGKQTYKLSKTIYPVKRVEVHKSELLESPKVEIKTEKEAEEIEKEEEETEKEMKEEVKDKVEEGIKETEETEEVEGMKEEEREGTEEKVNEETEEAKEEIKESE